MKNTIRYCIACILPCGALDVIRIVHSNGHVEEISGTIKAGDIMKAHPKHILKKPITPSEFDDKTVPKIVILPPDAELKRGKFYFLMPAPQTAPEKKAKSKSSSTTKSTSHRENRKTSEMNKSNPVSVTNFLVSDQYLNEIMSEKISIQRDRRRGRVAVWRPHLESISEIPKSPPTRPIHHLNE